MRKNKKLLSLAVSACMVGSMLAGCSAKSEDDADATSSAATTEAESSEEDADSSSEKTDSDEVKSNSDEDSSEDETKDSENYDAEGTAAGEFIQQMSAVKGMTSYKATSEIVLSDVSTYDDETYETEVTLGLEEMVDGNGNVSLTLSVDYDDDYGTSIHGDLLTLSKVDDRVYLDMEYLYDTILEYVVEYGYDLDTLSTYAETFGTSLDEIESLLVLGIPIGDLDLSQTDYSALEDVMERVSDDMTAAIDSLGEDFMTVDGDTYTFTVNNDNVVDIADAVLNALDGNMEDIYDAYIETVKATDYSEYMDSAINAIVGELVEGLQEVASEEMDDETLTEIESEIDEFIEVYKTSFDETVTELEDGKQDFLDEFAALLEEFDEEKDSAKEELAAGEGDIVNAVATVTFSGDEGSRVIDSEITFDMSTSESYAEDELYDGSEAYSTSDVVSISVKTTIEECDVTISAPENYASLADLVKVLYNVYTIYSEYAVDDYDTTTDYEYDDYDYNYDYDTYTQAELEEIYGVTLEDGQVIACYTADSDGVIITAYDGMEFYSPDDMSNCMMEYDDSYETYITIYVYDTSYTPDYYVEYFDAEMLEDNLYYYEYYEDMADIVYFGDNITIDIELDTYSDEGLDGITGGDTVEFLKGLFDLCEIVSPVA